MAIILETPNPYDISVEELEDLATSIRDAMRTTGDDNDVEVAPVEVHGAGVQAWDLIHIWLPDPEFMKEAAFTALMTTTGAFLRARFKKPKEEKRRRVIFIYGPDGKPLKEVEVLPDGELRQDEPKNPARRLRRWRKK
jgi:hypothetical protein